MENAGYITLTRQTGLTKELRVIANNIANTATTGFRQEGVIFSEFVQRNGNEDSQSMAAARVRETSHLQGSLRETGAKFDLAIEGDGFFLVETPLGPRLTRNGAFSPNGLGDLVTSDGFPVLDVGGAPVFIPPGGLDLSVSKDGTIGSEGRPIGQIGIVQPVEGAVLTREDGVFFSVEEGWDPVIEPTVVQGFLEKSNVNTLGQIARMIEVQRAYEMGQSFLDSEHERVKNAMKTFIK